MVKLDQTAIVLDMQTLLLEVTILRMLMTTTLTQSFYMIFQRHEIYDLSRSCLL